ncbi:Dedicator of cytokinesis protein 4 [Nowakowskiella sp. JEL0407]|nr:Dedicator of cytokinesis protein 4 [Nowakowskiella sp. JEL0407]
MEVISSFTERILNRYVGATIIRNNSAVTDAIKNEVGGKYIHITAVNPEMDPRRLVGPDGPFAAVGNHLDPAIFVESDIEVQRTFELLEVIPEHVRAYYQQNDVNLFSYSRPVRKAVEMETDDEEKSTLYQIDSGVNNGDPTARDFLELWIERTVLVTEDKFPNLLKRSPVIKDFVFEISPIKNAVIAVRAKNQQLRELEVTYEELAQNAGVWPPIPRKTVGFQTEINESNNSNSNINVNPFTMAINGAVDAPVNGGLPMYRKAFLSDRFRKSNLDSTAMVEMLEAAVEEQQLEIFKTHPVANIKLMKVGTSTSDDGISVSSPSTPSRSSFGNSIRKGGGVGLPRTNSSNNKISSMINQARSTSNVANVGTPTKLVAPKKDDETNEKLYRPWSGDATTFWRNAFSRDSEDPPVYPTEEVKSKLDRKITITAGVSSTMERVGSIVTSPTTLVFDKPELENSTGNGQNSRRSSINIQNDEAGQEAGVLGRRRRPLSAASGSSITAFKSMLEKFEFS